VPYYPFGQDDIIRNTLKTFPRNAFFIYGGVVYYNEKPYNQGDLTSDSIGHIPPGFISLYEYNVDRPVGELIHPFLTKEGSLTSFKTITTSNFNSDFQFGDVITGSYPMSASITRNYFSSSLQDRSRLEALKNTMNYYSPNSEHYSYSSRNGSGWDKDTQNVNLISIPSIFFGSKVKEGSLVLNFYVSGTLVGTLKDERRNGELIQTGPENSNGSGSIAGVALYNEGFLMLTGSWDLTSGQHSTEDYNPSDSDTVPNWLKFAVGAQDGIAISNQKSAWELDFRGTNKTQVVTMLANAPKGQINHSNNPTFISFGQETSPITGSNYYSERTELDINNIVSASYTDESAPFKKETYISKIGIYDNNKNLIAIAKLATPVKKTEERDLTFKLKLDI
tara:strand:+ start:11606 stop:12784 length:1179 start_codon:yes stop_codon:yes gene_type:complete